MLAWVYGDKAPTSAVAREALEIAHFYQIPKMIEACTNTLKRTLTLKSAVDLIPFHKDERVPKSLWNRCEFVMAHYVDELISSGDLAKVYRYAPELAARVLRCTRVQRSALE